MNRNPIRQLIHSREVTEGAGVHIRRYIGIPELRNLDPFLMLDFFNSTDPDDYIAGFPDHPHRGFITLTYMLDGHMLHRDSMGNSGDLRSGGIQWMKAARGVIHSEMPQQVDGLMRGFQLWINLPAAEKMSDPDYQDHGADHIPVVRQEGAVVKVIAGTHNGARGPVNDPHTDVHYFDVEAEPGAVFTANPGGEHSGFVLVFEGEATLGDLRVDTHNMAVLDFETPLTVHAGDNGCRFLFISGRPLHEPVVQYGPFVMNTRQEIEQAMADYRDNRLVR